MNCIVNNASKLSLLKEFGVLFMLRFCYNFIRSRWPCNKSQNNRWKLSPPHE